MFDGPTHEELEAGMDALAIGLESLVFRMLANDATRMDEFKDWQLLFEEARRAPHDAEACDRATDALHRLLILTPAFQESDQPEPA